MKLFLSSVLTAQEWRANHGYGTPGLYTLTAKNGCSDYSRPEDNGCDWYGRFVSGDGRVIRSGVLMDLPGEDRQVGDVVGSSMGVSSVTRPCTSRAMPAGGDET